MNSKFCSTTTKHKRGFIYFIFKDFIYLFMRDTEKEKMPLAFYLFIHKRHRDTGRERHRQREKLASCMEPDIGLDPGSPGSHPGPKAGAKPLSHPGIHVFYFNGRSFNKYFDACTMWKFLSCWVFLFCFLFFWGFFRGLSEQLCTSFIPIPFLSFFLFPQYTFWSTCF